MIKQELLYFQFNMLNGKARMLNFAEYFTGSFYV